MGTPLEVDDVHQVPLPGAPSISPDGRLVVYVLRTTDVAADADRYSLWAVATGGDGTPVRLTRGDADTAPAIAPDGRRVAFLRRTPHGAQLHLLALDGGEPEPLTELPHGAGPPVWSPDGTRIAFVAPVDRGAQGEDAPVVVDRLDHKVDGAGLRRTRRRHVHVLDLATATVRQLTDGDWDAGHPAWSPDGRTLAFAAAPEPDADLTLASAVHVLDVDAARGGAGPRRVGPARGTAALAVWTRDGAHLLVTGTPEVAIGHTGLLRVPADAGSATAAPDPVDLAAPLDRNVMPGGPGYPGGAAQLAADGHTVVFCVRDRGCTHVYATDVDGGSPPRPVLTGADVVVSGLSVARDADRAAVVVTDGGAYGEVAVVELGTGALTRLTTHTADALPDVTLFRAEPREFTVHDGSVVHGWLLRDPAASSPAPLLLDVHGGPHNAWHPAADAAHSYHQALAARGWSVLTLNARASDGYGGDFYTGAVGAWGLADERDFLDPLDQLVAEGVADPDRLAVSGYSYGGYMTCWLTGRTDRFAAAVAGGVVVDLRALAGTSDLGHGLASLEFGDAPERVRAQSPIEHVDHVRTPTLVLHGLADERCPAGQAEQWFSALRTRGVPARLVLYPGASHLFILDGRPSHRSDYGHRILDWLERHVGGRRALDAAHWQRRLGELAERCQVPGAGLAVLRLGSGPGGADELVEATHGVLSRATGVEVTPDTAFQIGSITKVWTATLVMQLVDEGRLDLDAPITDVLPDFRAGEAEATEKVTMRHLLSHTSGIDGDIFTDTGRGDDCVEAYVRQLDGAAQNHPLGATFSYCNSGFILAGRVVEVLTGLTWDAALRERLTTPLGLAHTSTLPEEAVLGRVAVGHVGEPDEEPRPTPAWLLPRSAGPAGLVNATPRDVAAFAAMHLRGGTAPDGTPVLTAASVAAMQESQIELPDRHTLGDSWGLGWIRFTWDGRQVIGHDGNTIGQSAFLRVVPDAGIAVVLLTNGGHARDLFQQLYREVLAETADLAMPAPLAPPADPPPVDADRYTGVYERTSVTSEVFERDGTLVLRTTSTGPVAAALGEPTHEYDLVPVAEDLFVMRAPGVETWTPVTFYRLPDGSEYVHYGVRANPKRRS
ncbi:serine hydrolase [Pseudonocardia sichuanensis]